MKAESRLVVKNFLFFLLPLAGIPGRREDLAQRAVSLESAFLTTMLLFVESVPLHKLLWCRTSAVREVARVFSYRGPSRQVEAERVTSQSMLSPVCLVHPQLVVSWEQPEMRRRKRRADGGACHRVPVLKVLK